MHSHSGLRILAVGVGDTFSERHKTASLLLECEGVRLAIDCPDRYRGALRDASRGRLGLEDIDHVLITHVHGDHVNGLEGVAFYKHFVQGSRTRLAISPDLRGVLWEQRLRAPMGTLWDGARYREMGFDDYFEPTELPWGRPIQLGPFEITTRRTKHHVPTTALFVRAGGRSFGYSADTAFDPELVAFLARADIVAHETNYGPAHTSYSDLAALPAEIRDRMRLVHYPDAFDVDASTIACLREGDVLEL